MKHTPTPRPVFPVTTSSTFTSDSSTWILENTDCHTFYCLDTWGKVAGLPPSMSSMSRSSSSASTCGMRRPASFLKSFRSFTRRPKRLIRRLTRKDAGNCHTKALRSAICQLLSCLFSRAGGLTSSS